MEKFVKGDVMVIPFPFSDLFAGKKRPALVIASLPGEDIILCQITSRTKVDKFTVPLTFDDFQNGSLPIKNFIRASRIFTAAKNIIIKKAGTIKKTKSDAVANILVELFST